MVIKASTLFVFLAVWFSILAIVNLYEMYSLWWAAFDILVVVVSLFCAWVSRAQRIRETERGENK